MTDLTTNQLQRLLDQATAGPWEVGDINSDVITDRNGDGVLWNADTAVDWNYRNEDVSLAALAPELAEEVLRMRLELSSMRHAWGDMSTNPVRTPVEQNLAAHVLVHIDSILGETND
ncbi:hypothetical protein [Corynebacterium sp. KPL4043]|uniref:hypothetical protein n=1 Tax=Corynebacterium sp. KPL4043 TaxID=3158328 RepID=UPI0032EFAF1C